MARSQWHLINTQSTTVTNSFSLMGSKQPWLSCRPEGEHTPEHTLKHFKCPSYLKYLRWCLSGRVSPGSGQGSAAARQTASPTAVPVCVLLSITRPVHERLGAGCATLHSNQETLWHFNKSRKWVKIHASKTIPYSFPFWQHKSYKANRVCKFVLLLSNTWICKTLLQQIRVILFFYLRYVMTYKI